jgi:hypothetical protein
MSFVRRNLLPPFLGYNTPIFYPEDGSSAKVKLSP